MTRAETLISTLGLQPHPEGGFYKETFRSELSVKTSVGDRSAGTAIYYLLSGGDVSHFHRIDADEIWYFHEGMPLNLYTLDPETGCQHHQVSAESPQLTVKAGVWFGACLSGADDYCLVSCSVMPAFEFSGFELASRDALLAEWPDAKEIIERLT